MLVNKETRIEDLERQKLAMEKRVKEALGELDLKVTNVEELSKKVKMFQTKCSELEKKLSSMTESNTGEV